MAYIVAKRDIYVDGVKMMRVNCGLVAVAAAYLNDEPPEEMFDELKKWVVERCNIFLDLGEGYNTIIACYDEEMRPRGYPLSKVKDSILAHKKP